MRAYVFTDAALAKHARQFAWLSVDTDNEKNAEFTKKFPTQGVPSFLIIDPKAEKAVLTWYGTVTVAQLEKLFEDGLRNIGKTAGGPAEAALARADQLNTEHKAAEAAAAYREALAAGGPEWPRLTRATESLMLVYELGGRDVQAADCVKAAMEYAPKLPRGQSFVNVMRVGIKCAASEKQVAGQGGRPQYAPDPEHLKVLQPLAEAALKVPEGFGDDKGEIYSTLVGIARRQNDEAGAKKYASEMWAFLEQQARTAPNAEARASLDSWRIGAAGYLGDPALAIPALQASERDLPNDYNPPSRLASIYQQLGRLDEALAANERAVARSEGQRRLILLSLRVSLLEKKGDKAGAKRTLEEALKFSEGLSGEQSARMIERLKQQLAKYNAETK